MVLDNLRRYVGERPGYKLPGEREMAVLFGVSRPRLRKLLAELERDGWLERRQGSGTYATPPRDAAAPPLLSSVLLLIDAGLRLNDDPFFSSLVDHVQTALQTSGIRCVVRRLAEAARMPRDREQGVITLGLDAGARTLAEPATPGSMPAVVLLTPAPRLRPETVVSAVECDNAAAGEIAAQHLIAMGVEAVRFFGSDTIPASRERLEGVRRALAAAPSPPRLDITETAGLNFAAGQQAARDIPLPGDTIGIITANDWLALGVRTGLAARGIAPSAHPLVSFDGLDLAADPALAIRSLAIPLDVIAADAVAELGRLSRRPAPPGRVLRYAFAWRSGGGGNRVA
jgi:DNA-binding LacI/PurR family transcriptional regulator